MMAAPFGTRVRADPEQTLNGAVASGRRSAREERLAGVVPPIDFGQ